MPTDLPEDSSIDLEALSAKLANVELLSHYEGLQVVNRLEKLEYVKKFADQLRAIWGSEGGGDVVVAVRRLVAALDKIEEDPFVPFDR